PGNPGSNGTPPQGANFGNFGGPENGASAAPSSALTDYLVANRGHATWIVAVNNAQEAAQLELQTGLPVMAMGGWSGSDDALTVDQLKTDIANGSLRYVILGGQGGGFGGFSGPGGFASDVTSWITQHATRLTVPGTS